MKKTIEEKAWAAAEKAKVNYAIVNAKRTKFVIAATTNGVSSFLRAMPDAEVYSNLFGGKWQAVVIVPEGTRRYRELETDGPLK